jgi:NAD(P)-dependent dehydrogenase (short-subunit alcohol dehydrogenase family)
MTNQNPEFPRSSDHAGQVYVVTGAASGIGRRTAELLAAEGASLILADIAEGVADVAKNLGAKAVVGDLSDATICARCADTAIDAFGRVDGAIIAAGVVNSKSIHETTKAEFQRVMDINLMAPFLLTKALIPHLRTAEHGSGLVFIGSKDAFDIVPGLVAYSVSKAALLQLAKTVAIEEGKFGIRSNVIHPDVVIEGSSLWNAELRSNRAAKHGVDPDGLADHYSGRNALGIALSTDDMAYAASFLLSDRARAISGAVLSVDGGYGPAFAR